MADSDEALADIDERELDQFRIGRDASNDLFLNDRGVSRQHARIFLENRRLLVEDLNSSGGTYLNDRELSKPHLLTDGSEVRLGSIRIIVEIIDEPQDDSQGDSKASDGAEPGDNADGDWEGDASPPDEPPDGATAVMIGGRQSREASVLPKDFSVELGERPLLIGRDASCDVQLDNPAVSREHARIKPSQNGWSVRDAGSKNGTFVNGEPADRWRKLKPGDVLGIGPYRLTFDGKTLVRQELGSGARIEVTGLWKEVLDHQTHKPRRLLEDVSLVIEPGEFVGLMGPVGCGKSTLMGMINGRELGSASMVFYDDEDLYANLDALKAGISYIPQQIDPQQVIVHQDLPVAEALRYTSRLRLPPDTSPREIEANIDRVLRTVRLDHRREVQIKHLSGGQRKKVAVAMELLSRPRVLLADEVTAGMDLGNEQQTMELFRKLADEGMTVVCITHYVDRLKMCDQVACFAGGRLVFYGPPEKLPPHFGADDMGDVYPILEAESAATLARQYQETEFHEQYVAARLTGIEKKQAASPHRPPSFTGEDQVRQWRVLVDRYVRLIGLDPSSVGLLLLVAPVVAWLLCVLAGSVDAPKNPVDPMDWTRFATQQNLLCFGSIITVLFLGLFGAVREIIKELPLYRHERFVNLLIAPYILSKVVPLSLLSGIHAGLVGFIVWEWGGLQVDSLLLLLLVLWMVGICGTMLGLLISAAVNTSDQAVMVMIAAVIPQILFSGAVVPVQGFSAFIAKFLTAAYWANDALKALLDPTAQRFIDVRAPAAGAAKLPGILALAAHAVIYGLLALVFLARKDGRRGFGKILGDARQGLAGAGGK